MAKTKPFDNEVQIWIVKAYPVVLWHTRKLMTDGLEDSMMLTITEDAKVLTLKLFGIKNETSCDLWNVCAVAKEEFCSNGWIIFSRSTIRSPNIKLSQKLLWIDSFALKSFKNWFSVSKGMHSNVGFSSHEFFSRQKR